MPRVLEKRGKTSIVEMIESAGWLQLDVADYLRLPNSRTPGDRRGRDALRRRITKQLRHHERDGDPLEIVSKLRDLVETPATN